MPTNIFGKNDNYHRLNAHALPSIIRKVHEAKNNGTSNIEVWGDGTPVREFMYSDDVADAMVFLMNEYNSSEVINIGTGNGSTIKELYETVIEILEFEGDLIYDKTKPNGIQFKMTDTSKLRKLGWGSKTSLKEGIIKTYKDIEKGGFIWKEK
jgi:GDP-L-fucose synthase